MRRQLQRILCTTLVFGVAVGSAIAQDFEYAIAGESNPCIHFLACPEYYLYWGRPWRYERSTDVRMLVPRGGGAVLGVVQWEQASSRGRILEVRPDGSRSPFFTFPAGVSPGPTVVDRDGNVYVLTYSGPSKEVWKIDRGGTLQRTYVVSEASISWYGDTDLASDQCTLLITSTNSIRRLNVCTGSADAAFAPARSPGSVVVLLDGSVLAAVGSEIRRFTAGGDYLRSYALPGGRQATAMAIESPGFVVASAIESNGVRGRVYRLDLDSGAAVEIFLTEIAFARSIVPARGFTAAIGFTGRAEEIPVATSPVLLLLAAALSMLAMTRLAR